MEQYLIDTNVVSDYFSASFSPAGIALMDTAIDAVPNISIITQIELLCWNTDETTTENVKDFIADSVVLDISPDVITNTLIDLALAVGIFSVSKMAFELIIF